MSSDKAIRKCDLQTPILKSLKPEMYHKTFGNMKQPSLRRLCKTIIQQQIYCLSMHLYFGNRPVGLYIIPWLESSVWRLPLHCVPVTQKFEKTNIYKIEIYRSLLIILAFVEIKLSFTQIFIFTTAVSLSKRNHDFFMK